MWTVELNSSLTRLGQFLSLLCYQDVPSWSIWVDSCSWKDLIGFWEALCFWHVLWRSLISVDGRFTSFVLSVKWKLSWLWYCVVFNSTNWVHIVCTVIAHFWFFFLCRLLAEKVLECYDLPCRRLSDFTTKRLARRWCLLQNQTARMCTSLNWIPPKERLNLTLPLGPTLFTWSLEMPLWKIQSCGMWFVAGSGVMWFWRYWQSNRRA